MNINELNIRIAPFSPIFRDEAVLDLSPDSREIIIKRLFINQIENKKVDPEKAEKAKIEIESLQAKAASSTTLKTAKFSFSAFGLDDRIYKQFLAQFTVDLLLKIGELDSDQENLLWYLFEEELGPKEQLEVVKAIAGKDPALCIELIEDFEINENAHREIAEIMTEAQPGIAATYLSRLSLDPKTKTRLALKCAQTAPEQVAKRMGELRLKDQAVIFEIAKLCLEHHADTLAAYIHTFGIADEGKRTELAKGCAQKESRVLFAYFDHFGIRNKDTIRELIRVAAKNPKGGVIAKLPLFVLKEPELLRELAVDFVQNESGEFLSHFHLFHFDPKKDAETILELAKMIAGKLPRQLSSYLANWGIDPMKYSEALFEIGKIAAEKGSNEKVLEPRQLSAFASDENLLQQLMELSLKTTLLQSQKPLSELVASLPSSHAKWGGMLSRVSNLPNSYSAENLEVLTQFLKEMKQKRLPTGALLSDAEKIEKEEDPDIQDEHYYQLLDKADLIGWAALTMETAFGEEKREELLASGLLESILAFGKPHLRRKLFQEWMLLETSGVEAEAGSAIKAALINPNITQHKPAQLFGVLLKRLATQGVAIETLTELLDISLAQSRQNFKAGALSQELVEFLLKLTVTDSLSGEDKARILQKMISSTEEAFKNRAHRKTRKNESYLMKQVTTALTLLKIAQPQTLLREGSFETALLEEFQRFVPVGEIPDFAENFQKSFTSRRFPNAIFIYAGSVAETEDPSVMEALIRFTHSVLTGTFHETRYSVENNPHLKTLYDWDPERMQKWEEGNSADFQQLGVWESAKGRAPRIVVDSDDPIDLLLLGSEKAKSCQDIKENPDLNKGVLGTTLHGWNRVLKVADSKEGPYESRAILRILWDGEHPVLYLEQLYPDTISDDDKAAIHKMARWKAEKMGLPLLSAKGKERYPKPLKALGGQAPYEYCDALRATEENGLYTLPKSYVLWEP